MRSGAVAGFKYFRIKGLAGIQIEVGGKCAGTVEVSTVSDFSSVNACLPVQTQGKRTELSAPIAIDDGVHALYFRFQGTGAMDFYSFAFISDCN